MPPRLRLAAALTVLLLAVAGIGVWRYADGQARVKQAFAPPVELVLKSRVPMGGVHVPKPVAAREAAFLEAIANANEQLQAVYAEIEASGNGTATEPATPAQPAPAAPAPPVAPAPQPAAPQPVAPFQPAPAAPIAAAPVAAAPSAGATISEARALEIAVSAAGAGAVKKIELEEEHGLLVWDIDFENDNEVRVDAATGAVVRLEIENDND